MSLITNTLEVLGIEVTSGICDVCCNEDINLLYETQKPDWLSRDKDGTMCIRMGPAYYAWSLEHSQEQQLVFHFNGYFICKNHLIKPLQEAKLCT